MNNPEISTPSRNQKSKQGDGIAVINLSCYVAGKPIEPGKPSKPSKQIEVRFF